MAQYRERFRERIVQIAISAALLVFFVAHAVELFRIPIISRLENIAYDARLVLTMPRTLDDRIVIVDIDEKSITAEGRFPWGRNKMAKFVDQLFGEYEVGLVGFDILFAEADESSGLTVLESLAQNELGGNTAYNSALAGLRESLDYDGTFANSLSKYPVVLGFSFDDDPQIRIGALPEPTFVRGFFRGQNILFQQAPGYSGVLPRLIEATASAGHINPFVDTDGVVRRVPMLFEYDGAYYPSLALEMVRRAIGVDSIEPRIEKVPFSFKANYAGLESLRIGNRNVPVDKYVRTLVPYRGPMKSFPYVSATDVIRGTADKSQLKGTIVLVGTSAQGLQDLRSTPVDPVFPGVEVHANLIAGMLDGNIKAQPEYALGAEVLFLLIFGIVMVLLAPAFTPMGQTVLAASLIAGHLLVNMFFWVAADTVFPVVSGVLMLGSMFLLQMSWGYFVETRGKRQLTGLFGSYVPPELVEVMARDPESYSAEPENRELSVMFSDIRGFTTISEGLSAKELADLINEFLTPMTRVIHEHRGTIDKYMGDAIMAFWGAPLNDSAHARHAIEAGIGMQERLKELNKTFKSRGWPELRIGVGINSGTMSVGNMGSKFRMAYTVIGDAVNLGSRLEGLTKSYGVEMIVGESTAEMAPEFAYRELDRVRVKGKDEPVAIFEPLGYADQLDRLWKDELKLYRQALKYYRSQDWDMAELQFLNLAKSSRAPQLYQLYAERVAHFRKQPPPENWDGVFTFTTK
ncbi:MAG: adenylate/guanylate cyclase domain-containing protein [Gammaproteobacteria bacterium]|nr:adenylate/guanylate cyclase domain-containing protein [Gammaproteobacteria bacterium]